MGRFEPVVWALAASLVLPQLVSAQDSHFWSHQYGARSTLLGGAVIAGVDDASATFYNPGALASVERGDLLEGTRIFEFTTITFHSEKDETKALDSEDFGRAPSFLGGIIPTGWKRSALSYAMFKRQAFDIRANIAVSDVVDVIERNPGPEPLFATVKIDNRLSEQWVGFGWGYAVTPKIGVGISTFVARRSQRGLVDQSAEAVLDDGQVVISRYEDFYKYNHYRLVWKLGVTLASERSRVGVTFTSPSFSLSGTGEREVLDSQTGLDVDQDGIPENLLSADYQESVSTNFKAPVSLGVGYSIRLDGRAVHLSAEWYRAIPRYDIIHVAPATGQTTGEPVNNKLTGATDAVVNGAIGVEQDFGKVVKGFASFATDFSTSVESNTSTLSVTKWDLYHVTSGARFRVGKADLTLGMGYVFGSDQSKESGNLIDIAEPNRLFGRTAETELSYRRLQFIVGLSVKN